MVVLFFIYLCVSVIVLNRVRADHVGVSVPLGPWKVLTSLPPGSLKVLASNSLWTVIMRFDSFALSVSAICLMYKLMLVDLCSFLEPT